MSTQNTFHCTSPTDAVQTRFKEQPAFQEGLYDLPCQIQAWMVPNGSWGESNAGLIIGDGASLLVDTLWDLKTTRVMLNAMNPKTKHAPIRHLINTHADGDHCWGNQLLPDVDIIASTACFDEQKNIKPKAMIMLGRTGRFLSRFPSNTGKVGRFFYNMTAPYDFTGIKTIPASRTFDNELILDVGGREVHLIEVGPAHTQGDILVYVPDAKTLFTGDIVFNKVTPAMWAGPPARWIAALDRILSMDIEIVIPGHGYFTDKEGVRAMRDYWEFVDTQAVKRFHQGTPPEQAARDIALGDAFAAQPFAHWNSPERIMASVHIIYRHLKGNTAHPKTYELTGIMRKQALLAHMLPDAQPKVMRT